MDVIGILYFLGGKKTLEKAQLVDVLCWSIDEPPPTFVIFIIWNIDLSNVIHKLTQRPYGVLLVCDCALRMGKSMLAGVIEWVEWSSVLQLLPSCYKSQQKPLLLRARCIEDTIRGEPDALSV